MPLKTRLDPVVKLRERAEDECAIELARASEMTRQARDKLALIDDRLRRENRRQGDAADWELAEAATARALKERKVAEAELKKAEGAEAAARVAYAQAHKKAEAVRRVAEARRKAILKEAEVAERKLMDEVAARRPRGK